MNTVAKNMNTQNKTSDKNYSNKPITYIDYNTFDINKLSVIVDDKNNKLLKYMDENSSLINPMILSSNINISVPSAKSSLIVKFNDVLPNNKEFIEFFKKLDAKCSTLKVQDEMGNPLLYEPIVNDYFVNNNCVYMWLNNNFNTKNIKITFINVLPDGSKKQEHSEMTIEAFKTKVNNINVAKIGFGLKKMYIKDGKFRVSMTVDMIAIKSLKTEEQLKLDSLAKSDNDFKSTKEVDYTTLNPNSFVISQLKDKITNSFKTPIDSFYTFNTKYGIKKYFLTCDYNGKQSNVCFRTPYLFTFGIPSVNGIDGELTDSNRCTIRVTIPFDATDKKANKVDPNTPDYETVCNFYNAMKAIDATFLTKEKKQSFVSEDNIDEMAMFKGIINEPKPSQVKTSSKGTAIKNAYINIGLDITKKFEDSKNGGKNVNKNDVISYNTDVLIKNEETGAFDKVIYNSIDELSNYIKLGTHVSVLLKVAKLYVSEMALPIKYGLKLVTNKIFIDNSKKSKNINIDNIEVNDGVETDHGFINNTNIGFNLGNGNDVVDEVVDDDENELLESNQQTNTVKNVQPVTSTVQVQSNPVQNIPVQSNPIPNVQVQQTLPVMGTGVGANTKKTTKTTKK